MHPQRRSYLRPSRQCRPPTAHRQLASRCAWPSFLIQDLIVSRLFADPLLSTYPALCPHRHSFSLFSLRFINLVICPVFLTLPFLYSLFYSDNFDLQIASFQPFLWTICTHLPHGPSSIFGHYIHLSRQFRITYSVVLSFFEDPLAQFSCKSSNCCSVIAISTKTPNH